MNKVWQGLFIAVCSLLGAGLLFLISRQPRGEAITLLLPPTPAPILVHVAGAVQHPGVYELPRGSRMLHAIEAADGFLPDADEDSVNLAAQLVDGEQVTVELERSILETEAAASQAEPKTRIGTMDIGSKININTATQSELETLPEIGPVTAEKIIAFREANGAFKSIEAIQDVGGIGPATFDKIKDLITVDE